MMICSNARQFMFKGFQRSDVLNFCLCHSCLRLTMEAVLKHISRWEVTWNRELQGSLNLQNKTQWAMEVVQKGICWKQARYQKYGIIPTPSINHRFKFSFSRKAKHWIQSRRTIAEFDATSKQRLLEMMAVCQRKDARFWQGGWVLCTKHMRKTSTELSHSEKQPSLLFQWDHSRHKLPCILQLIIYQPKAKTPGTIFTSIQVLREAGKS